MVICVVRFDLLYLILDRPNPQDDRQLALHLVDLFMTDRPATLQYDVVVILLFMLFLLADTNDEAAWHEHDGWVCRASRCSQSTLAMPSRTSRP